MHPLGAHSAALHCSADVVIALDKESLEAVVSKVTGRGAYAGIDPVAGGMTGQVLGNSHEGFSQRALCLPRWLTVLLWAWCVHSHAEEGQNRPVVGLVCAQPC